MARLTSISSIRLSLLCGAALLVASPAAAQVVIDDERTEPVNTSTAGDDGGPSDVTVQGGTNPGSIVLDTAGPAITVDSDNALIHNGSITIEDVDDATGILLEGGANRGLDMAGSINLIEDFDQEDTDEDAFADTPFATGSGRTGILVSGASPFQGNVTLEQAARIVVEGNQSYGINLDNTPVGDGLGNALDGNLSNAGGIALTGDDGAAIRIAGGVTGDMTNSGTLQVVGVNSAAFDIGADIGGGFANSGSISNNGFRFGSRLPFNADATTDRADLSAEDLGQAGSAIRVGANVARGINLGQRFEVTEDAEGNEVETAVGFSQINQTGSAPAILIDGNGTPLMIGMVSPITDSDDPDFDADLLYGFVNLGEVTAAGTYDDFDSTALSVSDATIEGGLLNNGNLRATAFVGAVERPIDGVDLGTGLARVIVLGDNAIAERIENNGLIVAQVSEATDEVYFDTADIPAPRRVVATAIDIAETASVSSLVNDGLLSAVLIGRDGTATVVRDASGTLSEVVNRGTLSASGANSDPNGFEETDFTLIALDLSANTTGVTFLQDQAADGTTTVAPEPQLFGDVLLGSGDDTFTVRLGDVGGDIDFGAGDDELSLLNATYVGGITNEEGLEIEVVQSQLVLTSGEPVAITSATFDAGSTFRPLVDGATGQASGLQASGAISFSNGSAIAPIFRNLINEDTVDGRATTAFDLATSSALSVGDLSALNASEDGSFLFDTSYVVDGDTLVVTVDLREATALGLDPTQIGVADSVFEATLQALQNNADLGNEIANLSSSGEFYAAYNQLLPEFAAASRQFVLANSDGAVGAVANHLDAARRSQDKPGGAWIQQFAYFADRDLAGLSEQYRGEGFGFTGGLDTALGPFHAVGVNLGFASTEIEDVVGIDEPLDVTTVLAGLYAGYQSGALGVDAYLGGGWNQFEQNRRLSVGDVTASSEGDWDGTHLTASLRTGYDISLGNRFWARPVVSLDYLRLSESAFTESGDVGFALAVEDRTSETGSVTGLLNFGAEFNGARTWIRPSVRVGYRNDFLSDPVLTSYRYAGVTDALLAETLSSDFPSSGVLVGFSLAAGSAFSSVAFDLDSDIRDGFVRHTGRIVVRLLF
ncbi:MAG: autotransporter domain-containing protein [Litorimonas sp.]